MNVFRAFTSGTAIGTNVYAAGGYDGTVGNTVASAEVLAACIPAPAPHLARGAILLSQAQAHSPRSN